MDGWDLALLTIVGYLAVMALARQMLARRDGLTSDIRKRLSEEKARRKRKKAG